MVERVRPRPYRALSTTAIATGALIVVACYSSTVTTTTGFAMGVRTSVSVVGLSERDAKPAIALALEEFERIDLLMSNWKAESEITRINETAGVKPSPADPEVLEVIDRALSVSALTGGAYDATVGPLMTLWGLRGQGGRVPSDEAVSETLRGVRTADVHVELKSSTIRFGQPGIELDLGGIAKGYGIDAAVTMLKRHGVERALVNAGGDLFALGAPAEGPGWRVGIRHPERPGEVFAIVTLHDEAVATSGGYANFFTAGDRNYAHILDPRTGRPADTDVLSASVVATDATLADALATAVYVLGLSEGSALTERLDDVEAVIIARQPDADGILIAWVSYGLRDRVEFIEEPQATHRE